MSRCLGKGNKEVDNVTSVLECTFQYRKTDNKPSNHWICDNGQIVSGITVCTGSGGVIGSVGD